MRSTGRADSYIEQVTNERRLAYGVLSDEQHHGLRGEVTVFELRRVKFMESVCFFEWQEFGRVDLPQALNDARANLLVDRIFFPERHLEEGRCSSASA